MKSSLLKIRVALALQTMNSLAPKSKTKFQWAMIQVKVRNGLNLRRQVQLTYPKLNITSRWKCQLRHRELKRTKNRTYLKHIMRKKLRMLQIRMSRNRIQADQATYKRNEANNSDSNRLGLLQLQFGKRNKEFVEENDKGNRGKEPWMEKKKIIMSLN